AKQGGARWFAVFGLALCLLLLPVGGKQVTDELQHHVLSGRRGASMANIICNFHSLLHQRPPLCYGGDTGSEMKIVLRIEGGPRCVSIVTPWVEPGKPPSVPIAQSR